MSPLTFRPRFRLEALMVGEPLRGRSKVRSWFTLKETNKGRVNEWMNACIYYWLQYHLWLYVNSLSHLFSCVNCVNVFQISVFTVPFMACRWYSKLRMDSFTAGQICKEAMHVYGIINAHQWKYIEYLSHEYYLMITENRPYLNWFVIRDTEEDLLCPPIHLWYAP